MNAIAVTLRFVCIVLSVLLCISWFVIGKYSNVIKNQQNTIETLLQRKKEGGMKNVEMNEKISKLNKRCMIQQGIIDKLNARLGIKKPYEYKE